MSSIQVSSEDFKSYRRVQESGKYNMIMDASYAANEAGLSMDKYLYIIKNFNLLIGLYGSDF